MNPAFQTMGVVNITPDSFSDGGHYNSSEGCRQRLEHLIASGVRYFDIGAESTAPFNDPITGKEEWSRYRENFFPALKSLNTSSVLSIDTYRPETFEKVFIHLREEGFAGEVIWNDVSGVLDEKGLDVLQRLQVGYIYTYNRVGRREEVGNHVQYAVEGDVFEEARSSFHRGVKTLKSVVPVQKIWLDPGFGFGKTIEQNWDLVKQLPALLGEFKEHTFLLGVSRKRFLQSMVTSDDKKAKSEWPHVLLCADWMRTLPMERVVIRLHDPEIPLLARRYLDKLQNKEESRFEKIPGAHK